MPRSETIHDIATRHAQEIAREAFAAGHRWGDIVCAAETLVAILVASAVEMGGLPHRERRAAELIDALTERAHERAVEALRRT